ncbi:MAG TPA: AbrB/MazE/SpoVT family DNA-binding domain-containing protein [Candidatus Thermoplasmatota archaeon]|nr:AbrB/MazE/SpoVT family DNA-binding domain-containing protein [Candidatus Thermoplasmatota archaeon]
MKVHRVLNRRYGNKTYHSWRLTSLPAKTVEELGWKSGDTLDVVVQKGALVIARRGKLPPLP